MWRWIAIGLAGALVCTVGDHLHATSGALSYPHVYAWSQAWWVPLLFFTASLFAVGAARVVREMFHAPPLAPNGARLVVADGVAFAAAYVMTSFTQSSPNVTIALLVAFWGARMLAGPSPTWLVAFSLASAVVGFLTEAAVSACGGFAYTHPDLAGITRWLPGIYLYVAPISARLDALLIESGARAVENA